MPDMWINRSLMQSPHRHAIPRAEGADRDTSVGAVFLSLAVNPPILGLVHRRAVQVPIAAL